MRLDSSIRWRKHVRYLRLKHQDIVCLKDANPQWVRRKARHDNKRLERLTAIDIN